MKFCFLARRNTFHFQTESCCFSSFFPFFTVLLFYTSEMNEYKKNIPKNISITFWQCTHRGTELVRLERNVKRLTVNNNTRQSYKRTGHGLNRDRLFHMTTCLSFDSVMFSFVCECLFCVYCKLFLLEYYLIDLLLRYMCNACETQTLYKTNVGQKEKMLCYRF